MDIPNLIMARARYLAQVEMRRKFWNGEDCSASGSYDQLIQRAYVINANSPADARRQLVGRRVSLSSWECLYERPAPSPAIKSSDKIVLRRYVGDRKAGKGEIGDSELVSLVDLFLISNGPDFLGELVGSEKKDKIVRDATLKMLKDEIRQLER